MRVKTELRQELMQNRINVPEKDRRILKNLLGLEQFKKSNLILTYISTKDEIDTHELIKYCFTHKKKIAVPRVEGDVLNFYGIESFDDVEKGLFGISEPLIYCKKMQSNNSICIVPALACDENGFRIGYGKGYYDRFLTGYQGLSLSLCYIKNIIKLPIESHDIAVNAVITEGGVNFGR